MLNDPYLINALSNNSFSLIESIKEDLSCLLNSKRPTSPESPFSELKSSLYTYGLSNERFNAVNDLSNAKQIESEISDLIKTHEPRLKNVTVTVSTLNKFSIDFMITATLLNDPAPIQLQFDSNYSPSTQLFTLKEHR